MTIFNSKFGIVNQDKFENFSIIIVYFFLIKFNFLNVNPLTYHANLIRDNNLKISSIKIYDPFKYLLFFSKNHLFNFAIHRIK